MADVETVALPPAFAPDREALAEWLRPHIDAEMLREIAAADYGDAVNEHLHALRRLHAGGTLPAPLDWHPKEVLELIRWSEPEDPDWKPGSTGERGHLMRAWCCTMLLEAAADPANADYFEGENQTLAQLLASVITLGAEAERAALRFVAWRQMLALPDEGERPFFSLAVLLLAARRPLGEIDDALLIRLAAQVLDDERRTRAEHGGVYADYAGGFLFDLTFFNMRHNVWQQLADTILLDPAPHQSTAVVEQLAFIGELLLEQL